MQKHSDLSMKGQTWHEPPSPNWSCRVDSDGCGHPCVFSIGQSLWEVTAQGTCALRPEWEQKWCVRCLQPKWVQKLLSQYIGGSTDLQHPDDELHMTRTQIPTSQHGEPFSIVQEHPHLLSHQQERNLGRAVLLNPRGYLLKQLKPPQLIQRTVACPVGAMLDMSANACRQARP